MPVRWWKPIVIAVGAVVITTSCVPAPTDSTASAPTTQKSTHFRFGLSSFPAGLDPALVHDADSQRITQQIYEGLVTTDPVTGSAKPALAQSWEVDDGGLTYTFRLRENVTFQDGQKFDAPAVCANFSRWYNFPATSDTPERPWAFQRLFRGLSSESEQSLYQSCSTPGDFTVTLAIKKPLPSLLSALTDPAFGIASPLALDKKNSENSEKGDPNPPVEFARNPVGTGPFRFDSWKESSVVLQKNPEYWGEQAKINTLTFVSYTDSHARQRALLGGDLDGYDYVATTALDALIKRGYKILQRDPFSVAYININQDNQILADKSIRKAISLAIDKNSLAQKHFLEGSTSVDDVIPPKLSSQKNKPNSVTPDIEKAKALIKQSPYKGEAIPFYYPIKGSRPYLPLPEKTYADIAAQLTTAGLTIKPVPIPWSDGYLQKVRQATAPGLSLMGINGSYSDPNDFLSTILGATNPLLGPRDPALVELIERASSTTDIEERTALYQEVTQYLRESLPVVPLISAISALALSPKVSNYPVSPVLNEVYNTLVLDA